MRASAQARDGDAGWRPVAAAMLAILVGIGLARFAYSPLIPALVEARWSTPADAAYLGAANLAGYLVGALGARWLAAWVAPVAGLRALMALVALTFAGSSAPLSFAWLCAWRLLSGIAGGGLMVLAAPTVLPHVPPARRGLAAGAVFTGVGLGVVLSGTLVPALLTFGLPATWLGLGALSVAVTGLAWRWWPVGEGRKAPAARLAPDAEAVSAPGLLAVHASYGLIALGLVPHMVFLVDHVARGLGQGIGAGGRIWVLFGIGALVGPLVAGRLADRFGFGPALRGLLLVHAGSAALLAFDHSWPALALSSLVVGSAVSGTVPLVLGQTQERAGSPEAARSAWGIATSVFAVGQAAGGYACSFLFVQTGGRFEPLFLAGALALAFALLTNLLAGAPPPRRQVPATVSRKGPTHEALSQPALALRAQGRRPRP